MARRTGAAPTATSVITTTSAAARRPGLHSSPSCNCSLRGGGGNSRHG